MQYDKWPGELNSIWYQIKYQEIEPDEMDDNPANDSNNLDAEIEANQAGLNDSNPEASSPEASSPEVSSPEVSNPEESDSEKNSDCDCDDDWDDDWDDEPDYHKVLLCNRDGLVHLSEQIGHILEHPVDGPQALQYPPLVDLDEVPFTHIELRETKPESDPDEDEIDTEKWFKWSLLGFGLLAVLCLYGVVSLVLDLWGGAAALFGSEAESLQANEVVSGMPIWAYGYLGLYIIGTYFGFEYNLNKKIPKALYISGQCISMVFLVLFFCFYYQVITPPESLLIPIGMLAYLLGWEFWANGVNYHLGETLKKTNEFDDDDKAIIDFMNKHGIWIIAIFMFPAVYVIGAFFLQA